jgi:hypothetical protein
MAHVLPEDLGGLKSLAVDYLEGEPLLLYHRLFVFTWCPDPLLSIGMLCSQGPLSSQFQGPTEES